MINRIVIDNFKSIRHLDLELRPLNILIGANGSGKSNLIGFFKLWKALPKSNLHGYVREEGGPNQILHYGYKKSDFLSGDLYFENGSYYYFKLKPDTQDDFYFETEKIKINKNGKKLNEEIKNKKESHLILDELSDYQPDIYHFIYTNRFGFLRETSNIDFNAYLSANGSNLPSYLYFLKEKFPKTFSLIEATVRSVFPFFKEFVLVPEALNEQYIRLKWFGHDQEYPFNASHLSDGTLRFIALTTILLQPDPPKLIIIDEPELGLHPAAITKLAALMKKAAHKTQIIIATQAPNLVDIFEPEDIITVDWEDGQSTFKRHNSDELGIWLEDYSLGEIWEKNVIGGRP
ncbi:MAG: AAA family ATPase [Lewinellaceae bacterium]|nr:AAA family ATPase [Saprospiraceae bacterium]MCB9337701.1 AAA family ATPase [Lewinellaceae bacterium]